MIGYLTPFIQLQRFFIPSLLMLFAWAAWRTVFKRDLTVGLVLYLGLVILVDGFLNTGIYLPGLERGSVRYSEVCAVFLLINRPQVPPRRGDRLIASLLWIYFGLLFLSTLRSSPMLPGILEFRSVVVPQIVAFAVARRGLDSPNEYRGFFLGMTVLVVFIGLFNFWDIFFDRWILKSAMLDQPIYAHNREHQRFGSIFLNPNYLGAFVALVFPASFVWALNERKAWPRVAAWTGLLVLVFCLVETQSRGPLLAFGLGLMLLIVGPCGSVSRKRRMSLLALLVVVFVLFMPGFFEHATKRFDTLESETSATEGRSRASTWLFTLRIIGDHPLAGIGFGETQFMKTMADYGYEKKYGVETLDAPHNSYLQAAVYAGIPALAVFLLANALLLARAAWLSARGGETGNATPIFGLAVGITGFLLSIYPDLQLFTRNVAPVYWVFFGLLLSLVTKAQQVASSDRARGLIVLRSVKPRPFGPRARTIPTPGSRPTSAPSLAAGRSARSIRQR